LNGRSKINNNNNNNNPKPFNRTNRQEDKREQKVPYRQRKKSTNSASNSKEEQEEARKKQPQPALEYRVTHIKDLPAPTKDELLQITLPIREVKNGKLNMLYDSDMIDNFFNQIKKSNSALIYEEKIALTGISGHKVYTLGKMYATIKINNHKIKHAFYIIKDDVAVEHEGILGLDFLRKQTAKCDYKKSQITIKDSILKLHPCNKI